MTWWVPKQLVHNSGGLKFLIFYPRHGQEADVTSEPVGLPVPAVLRALTRVPVGGEEKALEGTAGGGGAGGESQISNFLCRVAAPMLPHRPWSLKAGFGPLKTALYSEVLLA